MRGRPTPKKRTLRMVAVAFPHPAANISPSVPDAEATASI